MLEELADLSAVHFLGVALLLASRRRNNRAPIELRDSMSKRIKCRSLLCFRFILEQTAEDNGGFCARCYKRRNPDASQDREKETPYQLELKIAAADLTDRQKRHQLQGALHWGNESRINELLSGDTSFLIKPPIQYDSWLGEAISHDCGIEILDKLLAAGCDPNSRAKSSDLTTPLQVAVHNDRLDAIEWLLEHGADPNLGRPIVGAVSFRKSSDMQRKILGLLIGAGADVNKTFDLHGDENKRFTVLDWALLYDASSDVIEFLVNNGATNAMSPEQVSELKRELKPRKIVQ